MSREVAGHAHGLSDGALAGGNVAGARAGGGDGAPTRRAIAAVTVPADPAARRSHYLKVRDRASFEVIWLD